MKYCSYCGKGLRDEAVICPYCGCKAPSLGMGNEEDEPSNGLNLLAFFLPLIGLIMFIVFHDKTPNKANKIGKWALIGFCVGTVCSFIIYIIGNA